MKKILLIYPPSQPINREDRCQVPYNNSSKRLILPPTDLMYLAAIAESIDCECRIVDYTLDHHTLASLRNDLEEFKPDFLLLSITTSTLTPDLKICSLVKKCLPKIVIIAKGAHFLKSNIHILEKFNHLDIIISGEAEGPFKEIMSGVPLPLIRGITWRSPKGVINNRGRQFIKNLDLLPFPARHLVDNRRYRSPYNGRVQAVIKVGRGCPHNCFFCLASAVSGTEVRLRSCKNIIEEIRVCIVRYQIKDFLFFSDTFNFDKSWVMQLCKAISDSGLRFNWMANSRVDGIDLEIARAMRQAGCKLISVGVESGSEVILQKIGKNITIKEIKKAFQILKRAGLKTLAYYIIGFPWDTQQTVEDTIRLSLELNSDFAIFYIAVAFPGTRFFDYAQESGLFEVGDRDEFYKDAYCYPTVKSHYLSKDKIYGFHKEAIRRFYLRPKYIIKRFLSIRTFGELRQHLRIGGFLLKKRNNA
jgi:anaerobic magnesium-protoporphyrin IX monomethyl ester cyclase